LSPIASVSVVVLAQASILSLRAESKSMQSAGIAGLDPLAADESCAGTDAADSLDGLAGAAGAGAAAPAEAFGFSRHATTTTTGARATETASAATHLIREVRFWKRRRVMVLPRANDPRLPLPTGGEVDDPEFSTVTTGRPIPWCRLTGSASAASEEAKPTNESAARAW